MDRLRCWDVAIESLSPEVKNISHAELENAACTFEGIKGAAVVAVKDQEWGERAVLFVEGSKEIDSMQLNRHLEVKLARFKLPLEVQVLGKASTNWDRKAGLSDP